VIAQYIKWIELCDGVGDDNQNLCIQSHVDEEMHGSVWRLKLWGRFSTCLIHQTCGRLEICPTANGATIQRRDFMGDLTEYEDGVSWFDSPVITAKIWQSTA